MIVVRNYGELRGYVQAAVARKVGLLLIEGVGGTSKTYTIKNALNSAGGAYLLLNGHLTPASAYEQLFIHRDKTVFVNDIDSFMKNQTSLAIFKQLCDTSAVKTIQYNSKTPLMADLPREFKTSSNVIIDCNKLPSKDEGFKALVTRGVHIKFAPSVEEILFCLKSFATDKDVFAFISEIAHSAKILDLRKYLVAVQLKSAKLNWRAYLLEEMGISEEVVLAKQLSKSTMSYKQKVDKWVKSTGKSGRSYDRMVKTIHP